MLQGKTDSSGGHHCWTNCEKYGLNYGEYHYHNGIDTLSSNTTNNTYHYYDSIEYKSDKYNNGYSSGLDDGEIAYKLNKTIDDYYYFGSDYYEKGYKDGFNVGYNLAKKISTIISIKSKDLIWKNYQA